MSEGYDPTVIRSLAVSADDVVDAFVYTFENPGAAVLRATPPFHGRMRARLHVYRVDDARLTGAVHVEPATLLPDPVVADYPSIESFDGRLDDSPASVREARAEAMAAWRERAREAVVDAVTLDVDGDRHEVEVKRLA